MSNKGTGLACGIVGIYMILMGLHMAGHDSDSTWWFIADLFMCLFGMLDIIIGYKLITED